MNVRESGQRGQSQLVRGASRCAAEVAARRNRARVAGCAGVFSAFSPDRSAGLTIVPIKEAKPLDEPVVHFGFTMPAVL